MDKKNLEAFVIGEETLLTHAMKKIGENCNGILFVVNEDGELCGAVSDGDIRRWILHKGSIETIIRPIMNTHPKSLYESERRKASSFMIENSIRAVPIVDAGNRIVDVILEKEQRELLQKERTVLKDVPVVIMAGGKGTRLYPYTKILPKPLIPIGEIPIVERVIEGFCEYGISKFYMTVNYKKSMIKSYFSDITKDYEIIYVEEEKPLGTGGSIRLINDKIDKPLFVANCDCLIRTDFSQLYQHHLDSNNAVTVVTSLKSNIIPYGVIYSGDDGEIERLVEKPTLSYLINTGMYIINPEMIQMIPEDTVFHMTHLLEKAKAQGLKVGMYPISEDAFLDMGEFAEMKRMEEKLNLS